MEILSQACGPYGTNCYILKTPTGDFIIDPGLGAADFVRANVREPVAILNTHGHFDHVWDNAVLKREFDLPLYIHARDEFFLADPFGQGFEASEADFLIDNEAPIQIAGQAFRFHLFAGHTPGCCMIEPVGSGLIFSGDFLFAGSIGRWDFPYSSGEDMAASLRRVASWEGNFHLYPGHGGETTLAAEQALIPHWLKVIEG